MKKLLFVLTTIFAFSLAVSSANASFINGYCKINKKQSLVKLNPSQGALKGKPLFVQKRIAGQVSRALKKSDGVVSHAFVRPKCVINGKVYKKIGNYLAHTVDSYHRRALAVDIVPRSATKSGWSKLASLARSLKKDPRVRGVIFSEGSHLHVSWK